MPQRRVSATGFGGAPGLDILSGIAQGALQREAIEKQDQRDATIARIQEQQMESVAQQMRLRQEDAAFERQERERAEATRGAAAEALKGMFGEKLGLDPSITENMGLDALNEVIEGAKSVGALENQELQRQNIQGQIADRADKLDRQRRADAALEMAANPNFFHIATFDDIEEPTRIRALQSAFPDTDPEVLNTALNAVRNQALAIQKGERQVAGAFPSNPEVFAKLDAAVAEFYDGDEEAALEGLRVNLEKASDPQEAAQLRKGIQELERRIRIAEGS
jgi:hypothetical protein